MSDRVGQQLGNYRLMRLLGQGGFAEVYLGEHVYLDTTAAIKVMHARLASEDIEQFRREARTIARLVHPRIVRVLDFGVEQSTPYLVVDFAPNGTLRKRYPRGTRVPLRTIASCVRQVAEALHYAHQNRVIHRDVKPENMLIGRHNEILLSDFGIALMTQSTQHSAEDMQEIAGTIAYMAPEQIQSQAVPASDQYALAVVVYEWLCGARPFQGSFPEVAVKHTMASPPPLQPLVPSLAPAIEEVVFRALAKDPLQRYPTVLAFAKAFEAACSETFALAPPHTTDPLSSSPLAAETAQDEDATGGAVPVALDEEVEALPDPSTSLLAEDADSYALDTPELEPEQSQRTVPLVDEVVEQRPENKATAAKRSQRSRRAILLALTGTAALGLGGLGWLALMQKSFGMLGAPPPDDTLGATLLSYRGHTGVVWSALWMPKGGYVASASADDTVQVWDAARGMVKTTYSNHSDSVYALSWSPDGKRIASASYDKTVQVWEALTGFYPLVYTGHTSWVWAVSWSPKGNSIASAGGDKTVQVWDANTLKRLALYTGHSSYVYALAWSPDGRFLASAGADKTVQVWDALQAFTVFTFRSTANILWAVAWSPDGKRIASAGDSKTVEVWDAFNGDHRFTYYGHSDFVYALAWSHDGKSLASGGDDRQVQVWNASDGRPLLTYRGHNDAIRSLTWSPDNTLVASASFDKTVRLWRA